MSVISTAVIFSTMKAVLEDIHDGVVGESKAKLVWPKYMERGSMDDEYVEDLEAGGPGLATEKVEAQEIKVGTVREGYPTRYMSRTFALRMLVSEEAAEDSKYPKVINAGKRLTRAIYKTQDYDAANVLIRAANSNYTGGDAVSLASASHPLPHGGTASNTLSTAYSPSRIALQLVRQATSKLVASDGLIEGYNLEKVLCPVEQTEDWIMILKSDRVPESGNNATNPNKRLGLEIVEVPYWTSTTNWATLNDCPNGLKFLIRRPVRSKTWVDEDAEVLKHKVSSRWSRGHSDWRQFYFSNA